MALIGFKGTHCGTKPGWVTQVSKSSGEGIAVATVSFPTLPSILLYNDTDITEFDIE